VSPRAAATRFVNIANAMAVQISAMTPPKQGVRRLTEPLITLAFKAWSNFSPLPAALQGLATGASIPVRAIAGGWRSPGIDQI
jgi:hypothetical protein